MTFVRVWMPSHPLVDRLAESPDARLWSSYAHAFAPMVYAVPCFLGTTLAAAEGDVHDALAETWTEELGLGHTASHPALFERVLRRISRTGGQFPATLQAGAELANAMVRLCTRGGWPSGIAGMLAHESQFPPAYRRLLPSARTLLGADAAFFSIHATLDVEHAHRAEELLEQAVEAGHLSTHDALGVVEESTAVLRQVLDLALEAA